MATPVRSFNPAGVLKFAIGAAHTTTAMTQVFYGFVPEGEESEWFLSYQRLGAGETNYYGTGSEGPTYMLYKGGPSDGPSIIRGKWVLFVCTKAAGTVKPHLYLYNFATETWTHAEGSTAVSNASATAADRVIAGRWGSTEQFHGKGAAAAIWQRALTEGEVHSLVTGESVEDWETLNPDAFWIFDQALTSEQIMDLTGGGANQKLEESSGTSVVEVALPFPLHPGEEVSEPPPPGTTLVKLGGELVAVKRSIVIGGELIEV